jgi:hypothetical protein
MLIIAIVIISPISTTYLLGIPLDAVVFIERSADEFEHV